MHPAHPSCTAQHQEYLRSDNCGSSPLPRAAADAIPVVQTQEAATLKTIGIADCGHHDFGLLA
jgi:hypothetical protein